MRTETLQKPIKPKTRKKCSERRFAETEIFKILFLSISINTRALNIHFQNCTSLQSIRIRIKRNSYETAELLSNEQTHYTSILGKAGGISRKICIIHYAFNLNESFAFLALQYHIYSDYRKPEIYMESWVEARLDVLSNCIKRFNANRFSVRKFE